MFPSMHRVKDPRTGMLKRHHLHESRIQRAVRRAAKLADIAKHVTPHTFHHAFAPHLIKAGYGIRIVG